MPADKNEVVELGPKEYPFYEKNESVSSKDGDLIPGSVDANSVSSYQLSRATAPAPNNLIPTGTDAMLPIKVIKGAVLTIYANNAAAVAGGLTVGSFYRTGANPDPVMIVH
jgi:hypothetical protein